MSSTGNRKYINTAIVFVIPLDRVVTIEAGRIISIRPRLPGETCLIAGRLGATGHIADMSYYDDYRGVLELDYPDIVAVTGQWITRIPDADKKQFTLSLKLIFGIDSLDEFKSVMEKAFGYTRAMLITEKSLMQLIGEDTATWSP